MIDDSHRDRIHSSLAAVHYFDNSYIGIQSVACTEYCAECWLKELWERKALAGALTTVITETLLKKG